MNNDYQALSPNSRVWIYQASRELKSNEIQHIEKKCSDFVSQWDAHGSMLKSTFIIRYNRFVIFFVDESQANISGCSIDKSVHLMQQVGAELDCDFFNRMLVTYKEGEDVVDKPMHDFWAMRKAKVVDENTIVFNNLVKTKEEFDSNWEVPFSQSWHNEMW